MKFTLPNPARHEQDLTDYAFAWFWIGLSIGVALTTVVAYLLARTFGG